MHEIVFTVAEDKNSLCTLRSGNAKQTDTYYLTTWGATVYANLRQQLQPGTQ